MTSSTAPSPPCSIPGTTRAPSCTATRKAFPTTWERPSTCRPWCSATWAPAAARALPSRVTAPTASASWWATSCSTPRARTSWPGIRTPSPISEMKEVLPAAYQQFADIAERLEKHYRETQDVEFTIETGRLYMLQTRRAKRTAVAAVKIAVEMVHEGLISREEAVGSHPGFPARPAAPPLLRDRRVQQGRQEPALPGEGHPGVPWRRVRTGRVRGPRRPGVRG